MENKNDKQYKRCIVPKCKSTTITASDKLFIHLPKNFTLRKKWFEAMKVEPEVAKKIGGYSRNYCCEDHFDKEEDMYNYMEWKLMGRMVRLKNKVVPHIFKCQLADEGQVVTESQANRLQIDTLEEIFSLGDTEPSNSTSMSVSIETQWVDCGVPPSGYLYETKVAHKGTQVRTKDFCKSKLTQTNSRMYLTDRGSSPIRKQVKHKKSSPITIPPCTEGDSTSECSSDLEQLMSDWEPEYSNHTDSE